MLKGQTKASSAREYFPDFDLSTRVAAVPGLDRQLERDALGAAGRLGQMAMLEATGGHEHGFHIYGGTNHSESDILIELQAGVRAGRHRAMAGPLWDALHRDPTPNLISGPGLPRTWVQSACASGQNSLVFAAADLEEAAKQLRAAVVAMDALSRIGVIGFVRAGAVSQTECKPFHRDRDGLLIGEGAACLMLDNDASPKDSRVSLLACAMTCDAGHPTHPDESGIHLERCIRSAISKAGLRPDEVGAAVLHGTGTQANDGVEAAVVERIWPGSSIPCTSVKARLGHTMGAAGLFNCLVAVEALRSGLLPSTLNDRNAATLELDLVLAVPRAIDRSKAVLATCSGFGGNNVAALFGYRG
ncbi:beta-ketoacyl synthase N-terminal-like domain-containing protein [Methylocystis hirsuta]|uniref:beta-ketoacyl synthase N-terminal-like domain-containing protein n=1 Tax=Methylocystis hirsuta TaxID=369798 RepID=UPI001473B19A|nr:beta-ketoacyl synthase N-terminal-like domain-containing protein [Methylocystis hirsuta]